MKTINFNDSTVEEILCDDEKLAIGIITRSKGNNGIGVIFLNAGNIHNVGPSRNYVNLARIMANESILAFRMIKNEKNELSDNMIALKAITAIQSKYAVKKIYLLGMCSGGDLALQIANNSADVHGIIAINSSGVNDDDLINIFSVVNYRMAFRYHRNELKSKIGPNSIIKIVIAHAKIIYNKVLWVFVCLQKCGFRIDSSLWRGLQKRNALIIYSEGSICQDIYDCFLFKEIASSKNITVFKINNVDHNFTQVFAQNQLNTEILKWLHHCMIG